MAAPLRFPGESALSFSITRPGRLANQLLPHLLEDHPLPAGHLHLGHPQLVRRGLLGMPIEIPQHDESPIPGIQLPQHLLEGPDDR